MFFREKDFGTQLAEKNCGGEKTISEHRAMCHVALIRGHAEGYPPGSPSYPTSCAARGVRPSLPSRISCMLRVGGPALTRDDLTRTYGKSWGKRHPPLGTLSNHKEQMIVPPTLSHQQDGNFLTPQTMLHARRVGEGHVVWLDYCCKLHNFSRPRSRKISSLRPLTSCYTPCHHRESPPNERYYVRGFVWTCEL